MIGPKKVVIEEYRCTNCQYLRRDDLLIARCAHPDLSDFSTTEIISVGGKDTTPIWCPVIAPFTLRLERATK